MEYGPEDSRTTVQLVDRYDAVFWSEAAFEKFVLGYYLRLKEPKDWWALYLLYLSDHPSLPKIYGIAHEYPSVDFRIGEKDPISFITSNGVVNVSDFLAEFRHLVV